MPDPGKPLFLARQSYRRRRLIDVARLAPVVAAFLFLIPLLWGEEGVEDVSLAARMVYLFAVWFGAVGAAALIARRLRTDGTPESDAPDTR